MKILSNEQKESNRELENKIHKQLLESMCLSKIAQTPSIIEMDDKANKK